MVDRQQNPAAADRFAGPIDPPCPEIIPISVEYAYRTCAAHRDSAEFGRRRHRARLNYGDRSAYALAKLMAEPLLFKGAGFLHTDIEPALKD